MDAPVAPATLADTPHWLARYPSTLIDVRTAPDGTRLVLRPVLPQDESLIADLVARVSATGRRNRFHGTVHLGAAQLHRMSCIDYTKELAFVVCARKNGTEVVVAEARFCIDTDASLDTPGAEFALLVDDQWQRMGLGRWVMLALRDAAQAAGLTWLHGEVLRNNLPMLALMRDCGLCCTPDPEDDDLVQAQLRMGCAADSHAADAAGTRRTSGLHAACRGVYRDVYCSVFLGLAGLFRRESLRRSPPSQVSPSGPCHDRSPS